jgi:hypothetical protein
MDNDTSEFGKGLTYCLGLFLCHVNDAAYVSELDEQFRRLTETTWFYGATDHLYEIDEEACSEEINAMVTELKKFVFDKRNKVNGTKEDILKAKRMALDILMKIDKECLYVETARGDYE